MTVRRTVLTASMLLGLARPAEANPVDAERVPSPAPGWSGAIDGRAAVSAGNVDQVDLGGAGEVSWQRLYPEAADGGPSRAPGAPAFMRSRWTLVGDGNLISLGERRFVQRAFVHARFTHMVIPRLGVDGFAQAQANAFTRLQLRVVAGAGGRVVAVNRDRLQIWAGLAYMPEYERNDTLPGDPHPAETINHRASAYASWQLRPFAQGSLTLRSTTYAQPRLDDASDLRILQHVQLEASAAPRLSIGFDVQVAHDTRPPRGVSPTDLTLRSVLRLRVPG